MVCGVVSHDSCQFLHYIVGVRYVRYTISDRLKHCLFWHSGRGDALTLFPPRGFRRANRPRARTSRPPVLGPISSPCLDPGYPGPFTARTLWPKEEPTHADPLFHTFWPLAGCREKYWGKPFANGKHASYWRVSHRSRARTHPLYIPKPWASARGDRRAPCAVHKPPFLWSSV